MARRIISLLKQKKIWGLIFIAAAVFIFTFIFRIQPVVRYQKPAFLTFKELKALSRNPKPGWFLGSKLERFWKTPVISNEAYYGGAKPHHPSDPKLGHYLRLVSWNIEKSYEMENAIAAFSSRHKFESLIDSVKAPEGSSELQNMLRQREKLTNANVIVLQEMDIGVKRSNYIDAARELAKALHMNYAYGAEQLEIDPVYLGLENIKYEDGTVDQEATDYFAADPGRYKGVFGCAVLSRY
ncbi:MAG: hypothetical protein HY585_02260, partial [Candidatus Omnitrophica bacterium]|nr:hypothetical protein [Candidatus Omnitrophota bacterium]